MANLEFHALNISANPHPAGIYRELFERVVGKRVGYYGDKIAAFTKPSESKDGIFYGLIFTWTEIDTNQPIIDTLLLKEPDDAKLEAINIPKDLGFNWHSFYYAFREKDHILVYESKNSDGGTLSPISAEKILRHLFSDDVLSPIKFDLPKPDSVVVDLVIEEGSIEKVLSIPQLNTLEIMVSVPNADDDSDAADDIVDHLNRVKAQSQKTTYKAASRSVGIKPDNEIKAQAEAARRHGYVRGDGTNGKEKISLSTKSFPRKARAVLEAGASAVDTTIQVAKAFVTGFGRP